MRNASLILPVPLSSTVLRNGGIETLVLRDQEIKFRIPAGGRAGSRIRLPKLAHLIDPLMEGGDIYRFVLAENERLYNVRRDVELDLCLPEEKLRSGTKECINLGTHKFEVKIPSGLGVGQRVRLRGLGQHCNGGFPGDVHLRVTLAQQQRRWWGIFEQFGKPTERVIGISFSVPFLANFYHEWRYDVKTVGLGVSR